MENLKGRRVISKKGRDLGKAYLILEEIDAYFLYVTDGDKHPSSAPKRKNRKHVQLVDDNIQLEEMDQATNERIRVYLKESLKEGQVLYGKK